MTLRSWYAAGFAALIAATTALTPTPAVADPGVPDGGGHAQAGLAPGAAAPTDGQFSAQSAAANYPIRGIDVSSHDHARYGVNWAGQAAGGVKFAFIKATEGLTYTNPYFGADLTAAKQAGIFAGAYAFGRPDRGDPVGQADRLVDRGQWIADGHTLPPMLDIEWPYNALHLPACWGLSTTAMSNWIRSFVERVTARTGRRPVIYTNRNWWNPCTGNNATFGAYPLNVASYTSTPPVLPAGWSSFTFWQYAAGNPNQSGNHDKEVFSGDLPTLATLASPTVTSVISLRAQVNGAFTVAENGGRQTLTANRGVIDQWERFDRIDLDDGSVALRSHANGRYVTAENAGRSPLIANRSAIGLWERFWLSTNADGTVSLKSLANNRYVTAENAGRSPLIANRSAIGLWERFDAVGAPTTVSLRVAGPRYVTAGPNGTAQLVAGSTSVGLPEQFERLVLNAQENIVALRSRVTGRYVTAEDAGRSPLIANRGLIGPWEQFRLIANHDDGTVSLRSMANDKYVVAANATAALLASSTTITATARFSLT